MIHLDIKKLGRFEQIGHRITGDRRGQSNRRARGEGSGWEFVHICIDDASRVAFSQILPDERADSAVPFLKAAVAYYASLGVEGATFVTIDRLFTRPLLARRSASPEKSSPWTSKFCFARNIASAPVRHPKSRTASRATASLLMDDNFRRRCEARPGSLLPRRTIATAV